MGEQNYLVCPNCGTFNPLGANYCMKCGLQLTKPTQTSSQRRPSAFSKENILEIFASRRIRLMLLGFLAELVLFFVFSSLPMSYAQYQSIVNSTAYQQITTVRAQPLLIRAISIFLNNYRLASLESIPLLGQIVFVYSAYQTGVFIAASSYSYHIPGAIGMLSLMFYADTWLELPAYAIATTQSVLLIYSLAKHNFFNELTRTIVVWLLVGLELFVAALVESSVIALEGYGQLATLLMWVPTIIIIYFANREVKRIRIRSVGGLVGAGAAS